MNNDLMISLINTNVIRPGTELAILRLGTSIDGTATATHFLRVFSAEDKEGNQNTITVKANHIVEVYECGVINESGFVKAHSVVDGAKFMLKADNIHLVDGMLPEKIARVYGFHTDGTKRKQGKKRGRKPKLRER